MCSIPAFPWTLAILTDFWYHLFRLNATSIDIHFFLLGLRPNRTYLIVQVGIPMLLPLVLLYCYCHWFSFTATATGSPLSWYCAAAIHVFGFSVISDRLCKHFKYSSCLNLFFSYIFVATYGYVCWIFFFRCVAVFYMFAFFLERKHWAWWSAIVLNGGMGSREVVCDGT